MFLASLTLTAFRSYDHTRLELAPGCVVLTGPNGAGKTNVMEAISLLAPGRGLRGARLAEFQKFGCAVPWAVSGKLVTCPHPTPPPSQEGRRREMNVSSLPREGLSPHGGGLGWGQDGIQLGTGRDPATPDSSRRVVVIDGQKASPPAFSAHLALNWLTPAMDRLWTESPSHRRRFLDRLTLALDPAHGTRVNRYEEALAERNRLLKDGQFDDRWLSSLEHGLATEGIAVAAARREMVRELQGHLLTDSPLPNPPPRRAGEGIRLSPLPCNGGGLGRGLFPAPLLSLSGVENWLDGMPALLAEDRLREELARSRRLDAAAGGTSPGPHRSDLLATHPDKAMPAALCSTGEQKALLISLILAHGEIIRARRGTPPVLLLDEVAAHLDETRRESLFERLLGLGGQVFLSGADSSLFTPLKGRVLCYKIEAGSVRETALV